MMMLPHGSNFSITFSFCIPILVVILQLENHGHVFRRSIGVSGVSAISFFHLGRPWIRRRLGQLREIGGSRGRERSGGKRQHSANAVEETNGIVRRKGAGRRLSIATAAADEVKAACRATFDDRSRGVGDLRRQTLQLLDDFGDSRSPFLLGYLIVWQAIFVVIHELDRVVGTIDVDRSRRRWRREICAIGRRMS